MIVALISGITSCNNTVEKTETSVPPTAVSVSENDGFYSVVIDYDSGLTGYEMGAEYGRILTSEFPDIQTALDKFLKELIETNVEYYIEDMGLTIPSAFQDIAIGVISDIFYERMEEVEKQIPSEYLDELEGLASTLCNSQMETLGDGMLSRNELYFSHLMGDVARTVQCSAIGVGKDTSASGEIIAARNFDLDAWIPGYGSVTEIRKDGEKIWIIGWLGNLTAFTGFNSNGVFGALIDTTGSGEPYTSTGIYSYVYDLRSSLENGTDIGSAASYLNSHPYGFNHLIFLADENNTGILENNISGNGTDMRREIRYGDSPLMPGIEWGYDDIVIGVSAFMLNGNHDNFTDSIIATSRFQSYKIKLDTALPDNKISWEELKIIQSYDGNDGVPSEMEYGDIYNAGTRYITIFEPHSLKLEVFFSASDTPEEDPVNFKMIQFR